MKNIFWLLVISVSLSLSPLAMARGGGGGHSGGSHSVKGYTKSNGTYVAPHRQTNSNNTQRDNWSSKGNTNPDTGKAGTKEPKN